VSALEPTWRAVIRRMEVIVTLERVSGGVGWMEEARMVLTRFRVRRS
jgi:hypothetical protein